MKYMMLLSTALFASFGFCGQAAFAQSALDEAPAPPDPIDPDQTIGSQFTADADAEIIVEAGTLVMPTPFFPGFDFGVFIDGPAKAAVLEEGAQIVAETPFGFGMVSTASGGTLTISGSIITSGFQGGGVFVQGPMANFVNVTETGVVFTSGDGFQSAGIQALGAGDAVTIDGRVQTRGIEASGILVGLAGGISVDVGATGQVLTGGDFAPGLSTFLDPRNFDISFRNEGLVQTFGNGAPGMVVATQGASAVNGGVVATRGDGSPGVLLVQGNVSLVNNGTIEANGGSFDANIEVLVGLASPGGGSTTTTVPSAGVFIGNGGIDVSNSGAITSANGPAIATSADFAAVTNGSGFGAGDPTAPILITNTEAGTLQGGAVAIQGSALIEQVANAGTIVGDVLLAEGDDSFALVLDSGSVEGMIDGGEGNDALTLSGSGAFDGTGQSGFERLTLSGSGDKTLSGEFGTFASVLAESGSSALLADDAIIGATGGAVFASGTLLGGNGTITGDVSSMGVVDPGGSGAAAPGTLSITGDFVLDESAALVIGFSGADVDLLVVGGSADIAGALDIIAAEGANFGLLPETVAIVQSGADVSVTDLSAQVFSSGVITLTATPVISGNDLILQFAVSSDFAGLNGLDGNALAVAGAIDRGFASATAGGDFRAAVGDLSVSVSETSLDVLSPEFYDIVTRASVLSADRAMELAFGRIADLPHSDNTGLWAAIGYEGFEREGSDIFEYEIDQFNAALGFDFDIGTFTAGVAATYSSSELEVATSPIPDAGDLEAFGLLAYLSTSRSSGFNIDAVVGYQSVDTETTRSTATAGIPGVFQADSGSDTFSAEVRGSYLQPLAANLFVKASVGVDFVSVDGDKFDESGTGAFGLSIDTESYDEFGGTAAIDLIGNFGAGASPIRPYAGGLVRRVFSGEAPVFGGSFLSAPNSNFTVEGDLDRTEYGVKAGFFASILGGRGSVGLGYRGTFSDNNDGHRGTATLVIGF